jgi:hypothetical protein
MSDSSIAKRVLKAFVGTRPKTVLQIANELDLTMEQTVRAIQFMRYEGCLVSIPVTYAITPDGIKRAKRRTQTTEQVNAKARVRMRQTRAEAAADAAPLHDIDTGAMVANAVRSVPNSVFAMGCV